MQPVSASETEEAKTAATAAAMIAIVTRTRDRPLLLARAARSIAAQTFRDFVWIVVNDGGDAAAVRRAVGTAGLPPDHLVQVDLACSVGMEAAANTGVGVSEFDLYRSS